MQRKYISKRTSNESEPPNAESFWAWLLKSKRELSAPLALIVGAQAFYRAIHPYVLAVPAVLGSPQRIVAIFNLTVAVIALFFPRKTWRFDEERIAQLRENDQKALAVALGVRSDEDWEARARQADVAVLQFLSYWNGVWLTWVVLYILKLLQTFVTDAPETHQLVVAMDWLAWTAIATNTLMFFSCFLVMWRVTVSSGGQPAFSISRYVALTAVLSAAYLAAVVLKGEAAVSTAAILGDLNGVVACVVFSMFVGRLESKYVSGPIVVIALLYGYAAIQPLYFARTASGLSEAALLAIALALKSLMLALVVWSLETGRMLFYMARVRSLQDHVENDRSIFTRSFLREDVPEDRIDT